MIVWLLAFLALVGMGRVPALDGGSPSRSGWYVPASGPRDHVGEQPASAPTALRRVGVTAPFLEHAGALQYQLLDPLPGRLHAARCLRVPDTVAHAKRNARARVREPDRAATSPLGERAGGCAFHSSARPGWLVQVGRRLAMWRTTAPVGPAPSSAPARRSRRLRLLHDNVKGGAAGAPRATTFATAYS